MEDLTTKPPHHRQGTLHTTLNVQVERRSFGLTDNQTQHKPKRLQRNPKGHTPETIEHLKQSTILVWRMLQNIPGTSFASSATQSGDKIESIFPGLATSFNLHPLAVHFPIALWIVALLVWGYALVRANKKMWDVGAFLLYAGGVGGLIAVATGLFSADQLGHDSAGHDLVHTHRNFMIVTTVLGVGLACATFFLRDKKAASIKWALFALLVITNGVAALGADRGGELVYRYGVGVKSETPPEPSTPHDHGDGHHQIKEVESNTIPPVQSGHHSPEEPPRSTDAGGDETLDAEDGLPTRDVGRADTPKPPPKKKPHRHRSKKAHAH